ncbi:hypothetical protein TNCV_1227911 [Trichonephila clavipes]|nr:hypothetical protein TNCV_1227911 [Trichonephila clavipes]
MNDLEESIIVFVDYPSRVGNYIPDPKDLVSQVDWSIAKGNMQLHLSEEPIGLKTLKLRVRLQTLTEHNITALTPWVVLTGEYCPEVLHLLHPCTLPRHFEADCRT